MKNAIIGTITALLFRFGMKHSTSVVMPQILEAPETVLSFVERVQLEEMHIIASRY